MMRTGKLITASAGAVLLLWSCDVKDPIYETAHPRHGKITLTTDWTDRAAGIDIPAGYTVSAGEYSAILTGTTNTLDHLFAPGSHTVYVYNTAERITVSGSTATVATVSGGTTLDPMPGRLFTSAQDVSITKDKDHSVTAVMRQQVGELTLVIAPAGGTADRIARIEGVLSGVAGSYDMASGAHGQPSDVGLAFTKDTDGKYRATVRLLGMTGAEQRLTGGVTFTDGTPAAIPLDSDLTGALAAFNGNKKEPLTLDGTITETPTGAGLTATITGWTSVNGGAVEAN